MMDVEIEPGQYVVAVSGGVDSMALLHALHRLSKSDHDIKLVVAHLDHGIRSDCDEDKKLVQDVAQDYGLPFVFHKADLGPGASEAEAREARYEFLRKTQNASGSRAVITAHHQDDQIETAILNLLRGTGRRGLTSMQSGLGLRRPLLHLSKQDIRAYANDQGLVWREDSTNSDLNFRRNYVRHVIMPKLSQSERHELLKHLSDLKHINQKLDEALTLSLHTQSFSGKLDRAWFSHLPHDVSREVMMSWLRSQGIADFDRRTIERLVVAAKVSKPHSLINVYNSVNMRVERRFLALEGLER